jgi:putative tricarboxylic transport membrane protein
MRPVLSRVSAAFALLAAAITAPAQGWKPTRNVELSAASAAGGGSDTIARLVQKILQEQKLVEAPINVMNRPAAGGVVAWTALNQSPLEGHHLSISTANLLTNHITGRTTLHYSDVTSVAQLFSEAIAIAVRTDSPVKSMRDLAAILKADASAVSAAIGTTLGNTGHITLALMTRAAGGDPKKLKAVVFQSVSQGVIALLGGHVEVITSPATNLAAHHGAGRLRILALSAPRRYSGALAAIPTLGEQGLPVVVDNLRGVIGPKSLTPAQIAYWENAFSRMVRGVEWKAHLETNQWVDSFALSDASAKTLAEQHEEMRAGLALLGMTK